MKTLLFNDSDIATLLFVVVLVFLLFLVLRELFCWYYKINAGLKELKEINANLKILIQANGGTPTNDKI
jgi:hypothetical protein